MPPIQLCARWGQSPLSATAIFLWSVANATEVWLFIMADRINPASVRPGERACQRGTILGDWRARARARLVPAFNEAVADHRYIAGASEGATARFCDRAISRHLSARLAMWGQHADRGSLHRCVVVTTRRPPPRDHVITVALTQTVVGLSWSPHRCKVIWRAVGPHKAVAVAH